ncbi:MAG: type II toxin-antitoxin system death-on-curing family toxin [Candidatus Omnitrophica bacterium]|nr:type II toxin-antitoxin system death-on-curing family toxin [Candidatus Omnitrophota bacterium]
MPKKEFKKGEIVIYKSKKGPKLEVRLEEDTVWLTQKQMGLLFSKGVSTINEHIKNIYKEGELKQDSTIRKFRIVQTEGGRQVERDIDFYNLDVIISVGYRVKSLRGTQFRIWATKTLKDHLIKGYTINEKRLLETKSQLKELQNTISFLQEKSKHQLLVGQEKEILNLLVSYSRTLTLLEQYDKGKVSLIKKEKDKFILEYDEVKEIIQEIKKELIDKKEASELFGRETEGKFKAILGNIYQTFGKKELYPSLEEKAAHLLYFTVKDHPFVDGNKRMASFLFVYFLDKNNYLYRPTGEKKINDNALTALTLLIAISEPKDKEILIKIITNLLEG